MKYERERKGSIVLHGAWEVILICIPNGKEGKANSVTKLGNAPIWKTKQGLSPPGFSGTQ